MSQIDLTGRPTSEAEPVDQGDRALWLRDDGVLVYINNNGTSIPVGADVAAAAVAALQSQADPFPQYLTASEADARYVEAGSISEYPFRNYIPTFADGATTLPLPSMPYAGSIDLHINSASLDEGIDFTVSGSSLVLLPTIGYSLVSTDKVHIRYQEVS